jgi:hypothetical protein
LCDAADSVGGKLYILGGGWSQLHTRTLPRLALAIKLEVPWEAAGEPLAISAVLKTAAGVPWKVDGKDVAAEGEFALGRPPGLGETSPLDAVFVMHVAGLRFEPGRYTWYLTVAGEQVAEASFRVLGE